MIEQIRDTASAKFRYCFQYGCRQSVDGGAHSNQPAAVSK
jgi:hypothetical protein